jgi:hypothetical protein
MRREAIIVVAQRGFTFVPIVSRLLMSRLDVRAMTGASRSSTPEELGVMLRETLARSTTSRSLRGLRRATVETLFVPPRPETSQVERATASDTEALHGLAIRATLTDDAIRLRPRGGRTIVVAADAGDAEMGRAIRRAAVEALRATLIERLALVPARVADWLAERLPGKRARRQSAWLPPAGRG